MTKITKIITTCDYCKTETGEHTYPLHIREYNKSTERIYDLHVPCKEVWMHELGEGRSSDPVKNTYKPRTNASRQKARGIRRWYRETQNGYIDDRGRIPMSIVKEFDALPEAVQKVWLPVR